ncbi:DUF6745 domain-containing protein [Leptolyngbya ohadii]|uniref:DUF6745 domain-containing protein n=1 Tax=Leptolyngbya ohadii TaxID=1962290 RepID=UPI00117BAADB|nr:hypothetical protein [Leptolyngbya ohadii]
MTFTQLPPEQDDLIPEFRKKWRSICLSTDPIDRARAIDAIEVAYTALGLAAPQVLFFDSPWAALLQFFAPKLWEQHLLHRVSDPSVRHLNLLSQQLGRSLKRPFEQQFEQKLVIQLESEIAPYLWQGLKLELHLYLGARLWFNISDQLVNSVLALRPSLMRPIIKPLRRLVPKSTYPAAWTVESALLDFCISVLDCTPDAELWTAHRLVAQECGWLFPFERVCLMCDRPSFLSCTDDHTNDAVFHAVGRPAIEFRDGFRLYCDEGRVLSDAEVRGMNN